MVRNSGMGITHSGVLIETRIDHQHDGIRQAIVDLIVVENVPYIAIRYYGTSRRRWTLDKEKKLIRYYRKHTFDAGGKPWKYTRDNIKNLPMIHVIDSGKWGEIETDRRHHQWVDEIAENMRLRVKEGFHILRRNCQHVAAWTINKVQMDSIGQSKLPFLAAPPNTIFRLFSKDWLPDNIKHENQPSKRPTPDHEGSTIDDTSKNGECCADVEETVSQIETMNDLKEGILQIEENEKDPSPNKKMASSGIDQIDKFKKIFRNLSKESFSVKSLDPVVESSRQKLSPTEDSKRIISSDVDDKIILIMEENEWTILSRNVKYQHDGEGFTPLSNNINL